MRFSTAGGSDSDQWCSVAPGRCSTIAVTQRWMRPTCPSRSAKSLETVDVLVVAVEPLVPRRFRQHDRHAIVDRPQRLIGVGRDDDACAEAWRVLLIRIVGVVPDLPQARERERFAVATTDEPRLLRLLALDDLPFVETVGGNDAATLRERSLVRVARRHLLGPRVDLAVADL